MWVISREAVTSAQICGKLGAVFSEQFYLEFHNHQTLSLSYSSLLQSQDSKPYDTTCNIWVSEYIWMQSIRLKMVVGCNQRSTWRRRQCKLRDGVGGNCGEMIGVSPSPPVSLAEGSWRGAYVCTGTTREDWAAWGVGGHTECWTNPGAEGNKRKHMVQLPHWWCVYWLVYSSIRHTHSK